MYYSGRVQSVVYGEPSSAYYVLRMALDNDPEGPDSGFTTVLDFGTFSDKRVASICGFVPGLGVRIGTWFGFEAKWVTHPKYGKQLEITKAPVLKNGWDADTAERMLAAAGVGGRVLQLIRAHVGDAEFIKALGDQKRLEGIPGINTLVALYVVQRWQSTQAYFRALVFLGDLGLPAGKVRQIWAAFGEEAATKLSTNPWTLVEVEGITFQEADSIAVRLGLGMDGPERIRGAVIYVSRAQRSFGHLYLTAVQLVDGVRAELPEASTEAVASALAACHKDGSVVIDRTTRPGTKAVYEPWFWEIEEESAVRLVRRIRAAGFGCGGQEAQPYVTRLAAVGPATALEAGKPDFDLKVVAGKAVEEWGASAHLVLSESQKRGVQNALCEPISILTGLPGTGKTTSLRAVVRILQEAGVQFLLCAPTGIAAKNLAARTGASAYTIHRAFEAKGVSDERREATYTGIVGETDVTGGSRGGTEKEEMWGFGPDHPYPADVVIVDEASMLDQHLLYRLLTCTYPHCRLVLVGDAAQLPSVGPGNVLRDLIASNVFPVVDLREIFRQKDTSAIVYAAHAIFHGEVPACEARSDFALVPTADEDKVLEIILTLARRLHDREVDFQILSPRHAGTVGVTNLNARLRELLNPQQSGLNELKVGSDTIREGDRIMVVKNNYKLGVFNGDVGRVARIDRKAKEVEAEIFGPSPLLIAVPFKEVGNLVRLAYACTIHKSQGLEYAVIVMPLVDSFRHQLQRNLLYTAVTRAKQRVVLVGTSSALAKAVENDREDQRNTLFRDRLVRVIPEA